MSALLLYFEDEQVPALRLAEACGLPAACVEHHRFPDAEMRLKLPVILPPSMRSTQASTRRSAARTPMR